MCGEVGAGGAQGGESCAATRAGEVGEVSGGGHVELLCDMAGEAGAEVARAGAHKKGVDFCEVCPLEGLLQGLRAELDGFPFKDLALLLRTLAG